MVLYIIRIKRNSIKLKLVHHSSTLTPSSQIFVLIVGNCRRQRAGFRSATTHLEIFVLIIFHHSSTLTPSSQIFVLIVGVSRQEIAGFSAHIEFL